MVALALTLCWAVCSGGVARAQGEASADEDADRTRALELFQQSAERYREGRFAEAAALLREARELHAEPVLSYNLARALEGAGDLAGAVLAYRNYLEEAPDAPDAAATRARVESLERHLAEVEAERARLRDEAARARTRVAPTRGPEPAPWVLAGTGAGLLVAGGILGGVAVARHGDAQRASTHASAVAAADDAQGLATGANVMFAVGGVAVLAGAVWGFVDLVTLPSSDEAAASATIRVGLGSIEVTGTF